MVLAQIEAEEKLPADKTEFFLASFDSRRPDDVVRVTSCLSKAQELRHMHCHCLLYLCTRMLKVMRLLVTHELPCDRDCLQAFRRLEEKSVMLGDAFGLLKKRIQDVSAWAVQAKMSETELI